MSLVKCDMCEIILDTDSEPEVYYQRIPNNLEYTEIKLDFPRCENCNCKVYAEGLI